MTTATHPAATTTRFGWWLGQAVRVTVVAVVLGGLLGAALGAARSADLSELAGDLDAGRVAEVQLSDAGSYRFTVMGRDDGQPVVRWKVVGSGWRRSELPAGDGWPGLTVSVGPDAGDPSTPLGDQGGQDLRADIATRAAAAGVPVSYSGPRAAGQLVALAALTSLVLVLVLIGAPQPRWATKWAWFWFLLVPGGLLQLLWIAIEAPWSSRANRVPEPLPHRDQPEDRRLTGGWAFLASLVLGGLLPLAGGVVAGWLAG